MLSIKQTSFIALVMLVIGFALAKVTPALLDHFNLTHHHTSHDHDESTHTHSHNDDHRDDAHDHDSEHDHDENIVSLSQRQLDAAGITITHVSTGGGLETRLSGRVESTVNAKATVTAPLGGIIEKVDVAQGHNVQQGQAIVHLLSPEAAAVFSQVAATKAEAEAAKQNYQRDENLYQKGVIARQELESSRARALAATAATQAAQSQLTATGQPDAQGRITLTSPLSGTVDAIRVTQGRFINAGEVIADLTDPTQTELIFTAPPMLATQITTGSKIRVHYAAQYFEAEVLGVVADFHERGGATIIRATTSSGDLPPAGTPVSGTLITQQDSQQLIVPAEAVQQLKGQAVVFVLTDEGFEATPVLTGFRFGESIEILQGLSGQEQIAARNAFLLKAELSKGEADHVH